MLDSDHPLELQRIQAALDAETSRIRSAVNLDRNDFQVTEGK